jgi:hypothetical protein
MLPIQLVEGANLPSVRWNVQGLYISVRGRKRCSQVLCRNRSESMRA